MSDKRAFWVEVRRGLLTIVVALENYYANEPELSLVAQMLRGACDVIINRYPVHRQQHGQIIADDSSK